MIIRIGDTRTGGISTRLSVHFCADNLWLRGFTMITQKRLKELLYYNPKTGFFLWKKQRGPVKIGSIAGTHNEKGYIIICIDYKTYRAHRLAFLYMTGFLPEHGCDHKNGCSANNRWKNLRHATQGCNMQNRVLSSNNTSGIAGVSFQHKRWVARIEIAGKRFFLGCYHNKINAILARLTFEVQCPEWKCDYKSKIVGQLKKAWPHFNTLSVN